MTSLTVPFAEVIGDPIDHSLSPAIHGFWLDALGIAASYGRRRVGRADLPAYIADVRGNPAWRGSNVTMPLKLDALALADEATDRAVAAGAANCLLMREDRVFAANTDVGAIVTLLSRLKEGGAAMNSVTLIGTGGAARAALVAFRFAGVENVVIQARDLAKARTLSMEFGLGHAPLPFNASMSTDGVVNATPLGMAGQPCLFCDLTAVPPDGWIFDMVSSPSDTTLVEAARGRALSVVTGLDMLVEQAAVSFKLFFDAEPPRDKDRRLFERLRA